MCFPLDPIFKREIVYGLAHLSKQLYKEYTKNNCLIGPNFLSKDLGKPYCYLDRWDVLIKQCLFALMDKILALEWHVFVRSFIEPMAKVTLFKKYIDNLNLIIYDSRISYFKITFLGLVASKHLSVFILFEKFHLIL